MATITLELNDDLVERLHRAGDRLPHLLSHALDTAGIPGSHVPASPTSIAWLEAIDFLAQSPTSQQIIEFKLSPMAQERLENLVDGERANDLTAVELTELETYRQLNSLFIVLKARARASSATNNHLS
jgi:hypothetical protein